MIFKIDTKMNFDMKNLKKNILQKALKSIEEETNKELRRKGLYQKGIKAKIVRDKVEVHSMFTIEREDQVIVDSILKNLTKK